MTLDIWDDDGLRIGDDLPDLRRGVELTDFDRPLGLGRGGPQGLDIWDWPDQARRGQPPRGRRPGVEYHHDLPRDHRPDKPIGLTLHRRPEDRGRPR